MGDEDIEDVKQSSLIDMKEFSYSSDGSQAIPDEENEVHVTTSHHKYCLLTFCETRWYSAWLVMCRFFSLFSALTALRDDMEESQKGYDAKLKAIFIDAMSNINKRQLLKLIHFLPPLLQGIHFCQRDSTLQIHIVSIINTLQDFYMDHI